MSSKRCPAEFEDEAIRQVPNRSHKVAKVTDRLGLSSGRVSGSGVRNGHRDGSDIVGVTTLQRVTGAHHDDQVQHAAGSSCLRRARTQISCAR